GADAADDQRVPDRLRVDERRARAAVGRDRPAPGDPRWPGRVRAGIGRLRVVEDAGRAAGVPRDPGPVGGRWPDRRPYRDPRPAAWRRCAAPDEPGVDDLQRGAGDRADHRWLDPRLAALAHDLLVPRRVFGAVVAGDLVRIARNASAVRAAVAGAQAPVARLHGDLPQPALPATGGRGHVQLRRAVPVHRVGPGI